MGRWLRHAMVLTMVFALMASAAASNQCLALQLDTAAPVSHHDAGGMGHAVMHEHHAMHHEQHPAQPVSRDHGCVTCALCAIANATLPAVFDVAVTSFSPAAFYSGHEDWAASIVAVDPGIPKRIA